MQAPATKKQQLPGRKSAPAATAAAGGGFTDHNAKWLKPKPGQKRQVAAVAAEEPSSSGDDEDEDDELASIDGELSGEEFSDSSEMLDSGDEGACTHACMQRLCCTARLHSRLHSPPSCMLP